MTARLRPGIPVSIVLLLAALALLGRGDAWAQVSPGPLAAPHAALDGATQCFQCHAGGTSRKGMDARCLACHAEIGWMQRASRGTHAKLAGRECVSCHPDHGGRAFPLVVWDGGAPEKFDHARAGFALAGRHAALACRSCHKPELQKSGAAALLRRKDRAASWLGLETTCEKCHADPHRGQLGAQCARCHGQTAWKPAAGFDHAKTAYTLTGGHAKVECAKCHLAPQVATTKDVKGQPVAQWKPLPHADCVSCHKDAHAGRFKGACAKCHNTTGWKLVSRSGFDHDLTRYPLQGRHAAVACADCHDPQKAFGAKPKFARCLDCHRDAHSGTATLLGQSADCASCHTVDGFDRPAYTVAAHARSKFPLVGRHAATACAKCHARLADTPAVVAAWGVARVVLRPAFARCTPCHSDPHAGRFEPEGARAHGGGCLDCHTVDAFRPSRYDGRMHAGCVFPLRGAHQAVPCQACHAELKRAAAPSSMPADSARGRALHFDDPRRRCADCHENPHAKQFAARKDQGACEGCHDDRAFAPASRFDHDRDSRYRLEGAHRTTPCAACHVPRNDAAGRSFVVYRPTPMACEACHAGGVRDSSGIGPRRPKTTSAIPPRSDARLPLLSTREVDHESTR